MKKYQIAFMAVVMFFGFSSVSSAMIFVPFSQDTGFDTTPGTLLSSSGGSPTNDIRWNTTVPTLPGGLPGGYSIVSPTSPYFNTITWGSSNNSGGLDGDNWGDSSYSGLRVLGFAGNNTVGDWGTVSRIYHQNNQLNSNLSTLASGSIHSTLTIGTTDINTIPFAFDETLNSTPCAGPGGLGTCPDQFSFSALGFSPVNFNYLGVDYMAEFQLANFVNSALTSSGPTLSLWTEEGVTSSADVQLRLTEIPGNTTVPEPMTMALFGTGLVGAAIRKKFSK